MKNKSEIESSIIKSYRKNIWSKFLSAIDEYNLINDSDSICVCISGGKDSLLLALCFKELIKEKRFDINCEFVFMNPGYDKCQIEEIKLLLEKLDINTKIFDSDIFSVMDKNNNASCSICARMRRGILYNKATELKCNKLALGHHFNDAVNTVFMELFTNGRYQAMPPKLKSKSKDNLEIIRPLYKIKETDIIKFINYNNIEIPKNTCKFFNEKENSNRILADECIKKLKEVYPLADVNLFNSMKNINGDTIAGLKIKEKKYGFNELYQLRKDD